MNAVHIQRARDRIVAGLAVFGVLLISATATAETQRALPQTSAEIDALALRVAGSGGAIERAQRLVEWTNATLDWTETDYQQRTPEQIIQRGGGNCAELSSVLERLLRPARIEYRWVAEINVQPDSPERQARAAERVTERGFGYSVFGEHHNDHRWLEIHDERTGEWVPADPSLGIIGTDRWLATRMALATRTPPVVPAAAEILKEMIVPITVLVPATKEHAAIDRSQHYLIDEFGNSAGGRVKQLPSWPGWVNGIHEFAPLAAGAFAGKLNLHEHTDLIERLERIYSQLQREYDNANTNARVDVAR
ncbi:MAG TPA: transglutaminase family protein [Steroidobacteraceae bacterium]|nr:transglutaminase family protein [Steroidobacteraceae bacterium]